MKPRPRRSKKTRFSRTFTTPFFSSRSNILALIGIVASLIVIGFLTIKIRQYQSLKSHASAHTVALSIVPNQQALPPDGIFHIWASADSGVAFSHLVLHFNPNLVALVEDIALVNPSLARIVKKSTLAEANSTGEIVFALALDPSFRNTPPAGNFELATLKFTQKTLNNINTNLIFVNSLSSMVGIDQGLFSITSIGANLILNPTPAPTPSPVPTSTPTPIPDTTPPTLMITNPLPGSILNKGEKINFTATATDIGSGMNKVDFYINTPLKCSDSSSPYLCVWKVGPKGTYTLKAIALDKAGNKTTQLITVTSK